MTGHTLPELLFPLLLLSYPKDIAAKAVKIQVYGCGLLQSPYTVPDPQVMGCHGGKQHAINLPQ